MHCENMRTAQQSFSQSRSSLLSQKPSSEPLLEWFFVVSILLNKGFCKESAH